MTETAQAGMFRPLTENPFLRLATVFIFYIFEGVPMGLFYIAIPAFMASGGSSTTEIAAVVGAFALPWTLKLVNGFIMDRYTFLPMGRRRIWIIGSQLTMALTMLIASLFNPEATQTAVLSAIAFCVSMATTFQDVSIDSLVVDIMDEDEQAKAGGIMFGAQTLGISGSAAACGYLLQHYGSAPTFLAVAAFLLAGVVFAISLRERPEERRFPWSQGQSHPRNLDIQIEAWWPLLKTSFFAMLAKSSLVIVPFLLMRSIPAAIYDIFNPVLATKYVGYSTSAYTGIASLSALATGLFGLFIGGWLVAKVGKGRILAINFSLLAILLIGVALIPEYWSNPAVLYALVWGIDLFGIMIAIAMIPLAMQVCSPSVAATQFTIYMALGNFGRPIGASIVAATSSLDPQLMFGTIGAIMIAAALSTLLLKRGEVTPEQEQATHHGVGAAPAEN
ncbi:AmpG permease [Altererythrobacter epoxidivorans]|uniref:AmpG permease n=1 Tax=Altererythrobacter epoxidivorans TaxID=361183 RepID=A0A0M4MG77_9SPHN|nr:MFS transporter [Altererythrobacter epoxidivorans]ALE16318.1 AmpG permease [Altererythrobacter epoxidivorans]